LLIGILAEPAIADHVAPWLVAMGLPEAPAGTLAIILAMIVASAVTMVYGELVPKKLAVTKPVGSAKAVQGFARGFTWLARGPIRVLNSTANWLLLRLGLTPREELASARSAEELMTVVRHSAKEGSLPEETAFMVKRSLEFSDKNGEDVATPRVKIVYLELDEPVSRVMELAKQSGHSRFPVVKDTIDHVAGIVHVKQAVTVPFAKRDRTPVKAIMAPPLFVPASVGLDVILDKLRANPLQVAVTIDEFGGTDGLVTVEDLVEELVGEVMDEHDASGAAIKQLSEVSWVASGLLRPDEISEVIGITLPEDEDFETLGGLILDKLEAVPEVGDAVQLDAIDHSGKLRRLKLSVRSMDGHRVDRAVILVQPPDGPPAGEAA
jgi:CBS domain containing-hemolysin-like protein